MQQQKDKQQKKQVVLHQILKLWGSKDTVK